MKIVIISCTAPPEPVVSGRVNYDIAEHFAKNGNRVIFAHPPMSRPIGAHKTTQKSKGPELINDFLTRIQLPTKAYPGKSLFGRTIESLNFGLSAAKVLRPHLAAADVIYTTLWPFIGQIVFARLTSFAKHKTIVNIQDIYPESFISKISNGLARSCLQPLKQLDKYVACSAARLTVVSESMREFYIQERKIDEKKVALLENWQDEDQFLNPIPIREKIISKYNLQEIANMRILMYLGNIGPVAGLENVINDFGKNRCPNTCLVIAGNGSAKSDCEVLARQYPTANIRFISVPTGLQAVVELQSLADILLLPILPSKIESSVPSKLIAYLFSAKPIISNAASNSQIGNIINSANCGLLVAKNQSWTNAISIYANLEKHELLKIGMSGRQLALGRFSKRAGLKRAESIFKSVTATN